MLETTFQKIILALNLGSLACYGLTLLVLVTPLRRLFETSGFFSGYESIGILMLGLGAAGTLAQVAGVLSLVHLIRTRRWTWDLSLSMLTAVLLPVVLGAWFFVSA